MFDITLGNMLPENFYPITGDITITDMKTNKAILTGNCEITLNSTYIYVGVDYKLLGYRNYSNVIAINANDIPPSFRYCINTNVDNDEFNKMNITGTCKCDHEITFDERVSHIKLTPLKQVDIENNEIKLCDINVWKEE